MKKTCTRYAFPLLFVLCACSGSGGETSIPAAEPPAALDPNPYSRTPIPEGTEYISNLNYENPGAMGDNDGPAVVIYSEQGYNKAEMEVAPQPDRHPQHPQRRAGRRRLHLPRADRLRAVGMDEQRGRRSGLERQSGRLAAVFYSSYDPKVWWHSTDVFLDPTRLQNRAGQLRRRRAGEAERVRYGRRPCRFGGHRAEQRACRRQQHRVLYGRTSP